MLALRAGIAAMSFAAPGMAAAPAFDGTYIGTSRLVVAKAAACAPGGPITVHVQDGRFDYRWQHAQDSMIRIAADGTYSALWPNMPVTADKRLAAWPRIDGVAGGGHLTGSYGTRWCTYSYRLDQVP